MRLTKDGITYFTRVSQKKKGYKLKIKVLDVTPCRWVSSSGRFERYAQGKTGLTVNIPSKRRRLFTKQHGITSRKIGNFSCTALRT
jgi:hypothetical protein